jgi:ketosteroid isomerase-like protein
MSEENVERLKRALDAFSRRGRAAWRELCDPDFEWVPVGDWPEAGPIRGRDAVWDMIVASDEPWERGAYQIIELADRGDKVAAHLRRDLRGKSSGVKVNYDYWFVLTFRNHKAVRGEFFQDRAGALEAAGLEE